MGLPFFKQDQDAACLFLLEKQGSVGSVCVYDEIHTAQGGIHQMMTTLSSLFVEVLDSHSKGSKVLNYLPGTPVAYNFNKGYFGAQRPVILPLGVPVTQITELRS